MTPIDKSDPFGALAATNASMKDAFSDPFGAPATQPDASQSLFPSNSNDPFASQGLSASIDPFASSTKSADPFSDPFGASHFTPTPAEAVEPSVKPTDAFKNDPFAASSDAFSSPSFGLADRAGQSPQTVPKGDNNSVYDEIDPTYSEVTDVLPPSTNDGFAEGPKSLDWFLTGSSKEKPASSSDQKMIPAAVSYEYIDVINTPRT